MYKGLLIRALTICNNQPDFMRAAISYAQGLISRGFPAKTLWRSWSKFCYQKVTHPGTRRELLNQFKTWVEGQDFSACHLDENAQRQQRLLATMSLFKSSLMCGYDAVNHILSALGRQKISELDIETTAHAMADRESSIIYNMDPGTVLDLAADPRGNYAADTLLHVLHTHSTLNVERWRPDQPISSCAILLGSGDHWQAVLMDRDKQWFVLNRYDKCPIQNIMRFLNSWLSNGAVYEIGMLQHGILTTQSAEEAATTSPPTSLPRKRRLPCGQGNPQKGPSATSWLHLARGYFCLRFSRP